MAQRNPRNSDRKQAAGLTAKERKQLMFGGGVLLLCLTGLIYAMAMGGIIVP